MIIGIGNDIVDIRRIEKTLETYGERFVERIFTEVEIRKSERRAQRAASYAKRFAAKEALGKALGLGLRDPATLHNIAVLSDGLGRPSFEYAPPLADWMKARRLRAHLSLSDETDTAMAFVVVEQEDTP